MIRYAMLSLVAIGLAACGQRQEPPTAADGQAVETILPSQAPAQGSGEAPSEAPPKAQGEDAATQAEAFDAVGTEPFWAVQVRKDSLRLSRPDYAEVIVAAPPPSRERDNLVWETDAMIVSIAPGPCSDGMSDRPYRFVAQVRVGREILKGCAYRPGAAPTAGPGS